MNFYQTTSDKDIKIVTQSAMEGERDIHIMESHCASKIINDTIQELSMEDTWFDLGLKDIQHEVALSQKKELIEFPGEVLNLIGEFVLEDPDTSTLPNFSMTCRTLYKSYIEFKIDFYDV